MQGLRQERKLLSGKRGTPAGQEKHPYQSQWSTCLRVLQAAGYAIAIGASEGKSRRSETTSCLEAALKQEEGELGENVHRKRAGRVREADPKEGLEMEYAFRIPLNKQIVKPLVITRKTQKGKGS